MMTESNRRRVDDKVESTNKSRKSSGSISNLTPTPCVPSSLVFNPAADDAVNRVISNFRLDPELAQGAVDLAASLRVDDPGIFLTFRSGTEVRTNLQRPGAGKPCEPGANDNAALQNLKDWITGLVPESKRQFIKLSGQFGMALGSLTQDEFNDLQLTLSFCKPVPLPAWVVAMATNGHSLGGSIVVTGTGVGEACMSKGPSNVFCD